jgi:hypothetical protein
MFSMKTFFKVSCFHLLVLVSSLKQREIIVQDTDFILRQTGEKIVLVGPNVVVKGPPYLPDVTGNSYCIDHVDSTCSSNGACSSCTTFNQVMKSCLQNISNCILYDKICISSEIYNAEYK